MHSQSTFQNLVTRSKLTRFPTSSNRIETLASTPARIERIESHARSARVLVHNSLRLLITSFLSLKKSYGTPKEKTLYSQMDQNAFVQRLISQRPYVFFAPSDDTLLRDGSTPNGKLWQTVGTEDESLIKIEEYLTYDEMQISALIGVSSKAYLINSGSRHNKGVPSSDPTYPMEGIYTGLVGARFEKLDLMESQYILIQKQYNTEEYFGKKPTKPDSFYTKKLEILARFFDQGDGTDYFFPTYQDIENQFNSTDPEVKRAAHYKYYKLRMGLFSPSIFINIPVFQKRMRLSVETFLGDANDRGKNEEKPVCCHVVGLGLGVWCITPIQVYWFLDGFITALKSNNYRQITDIDFSWLPKEIDHLGPVPNGERFVYGQNDIKITFSTRDPFERDSNQDKLTVAMYAWDSNALPGNEYWAGMLSASGDPAAACSSTIPQIQNPHINTELLDNIHWIRPRKQIDFREVINSGKRSKL